MTSPPKQREQGLGRGELNIQFFLRVIHHSRFLLLGFGAISIVASVVFALSLPNEFRSDVLLSPNNPSNSGPLSNLGSRYGGLASLAGIDISSGTVDKTKYGIAVLGSRKFLGDFVQRRSILVDLFAADGWNADTNTLKIDGDLYDVDTQQWVREVSPPKTIVPSAQEAVEELKDRMSIDVDKDSGFVRLSLVHYSPYVAKRWLDWLVEDLHSAVMQEDVRSAENAIEFLRKRAEETNLQELRVVLFRLIEEQLKTVMLSQMSPEYLFKTIDPPNVAEKKFKPRRALIVAAGLMLGMALLRPGSMTRSSAGS